MNVWLAWATRLVQVGFAKFYNPNIWTNYTPGYFYILWLLEKARLILSFDNPFFINQLFKLPANIADILTGVLIYKILKKKSSNLAFLGMLFYIFNPALIFNSSIWGQIDSFLTFLMLLSIFFILEKRNIFISSIFLSLAFLIKAQALFLAPMILLILVKNYSKKEIIKFLAVFSIIVSILSFPFFPLDPVLGLVRLTLQMGKDYPHTTLSAFNFWYLFGNWQKDTVLLLGLSKQLWGFLIFVFLELIIFIYSLRQKKLTQNFVYLAIGLSLFNFFLFPTRIHERYLLSIFPFFLIAGFLFKSWFLVFCYSVMSFIHLGNLYYVYVNYQPNFLKVEFIFNLIRKLGIFFSLVSIFIFFAMLFIFLRKDKLKQIDKIIKQFIKTFSIVKKENTKEVKLKNARLFLLLLLSFSFLIRLFRLEYPKDHVFDEVYHVFTASEMVKGSARAWEWWNKAPEGFAYEWTHPPLAKLFIAGGILLFGDNSFGWRFPAAFFGTGIILLTFLLAKQLFKNEKLAIMAATILSFDGLLLVMSRIGMADVYLLFFILATILFAIKANWMLTATFLGLSMATKWTGIYLLPVVIILIFASFLQTKKKNLNIFVKYLLFPFSSLIIIPVLVYMLSYILFFKTGHTLNQFWELQKQMWWYHTRLKATHSYQSASYTWPFLIRPVWFWVKYETDKIGNIYNLGNPVLWWSGILIMPFVLIQAVKAAVKRSFQLIFTVLCYFIFWLPWIFSPRIMFLHHYLPALPFLSLLLAFVVNKIKIGKKKKGYINFVFLIILAISFTFFYPIYTGILIPKNLLKYFFWLSSWR